jgi:hypothetical protein
MSQLWTIFDLNEVLRRALKVRRRISCGSPNLADTQNVYDAAFELKVQDIGLNNMRGARAQMYDILFRFA